MRIEIATDLKGCSKRARRGQQQRVHVGLMKQTAEGSGKKHMHSALLRPVKLLPADIKSWHTLCQHKFIPLANGE